MTNQDKTVLVTGGSGFIATHCILKLAAAGYKIKSTVRNLERASELNKILDRAGSTYERSVSYTHLTLPTSLAV